jgi:hypothetical protein
MSVYVVRAFVRLREILASNTALARKLDELERKYKNHDEVIVINGAASASPPTSAGKVNLASLIHSLPQTPRINQMPPPHLLNTQTNARSWIQKTAQTAATGSLFAISITKTAKAHPIAGAPT